MAKADTELSRWLNEERQIYSILNRKLSGIDVPEDLARNIIRQRPIPIASGWKLPRALQIAAAIAVLAGSGRFIGFVRPPGATSPSYETYLTRLVSKGYRMSLESSDLKKIRNFLAGNQSPGGLYLPVALEQTAPLGCATLSWNGEIPFPCCALADRNDQKLFLFVVDQARPSPMPREPVRRK